MGTQPNASYDVVIVGAGQAGLSVGYHLGGKGLSFLMLEANERIGDQWRNQWESLRLFTPARYDGLPGMRFPASPHTFPTKDEMADYLEAYADSMELPVRTGVRVTSVSPNAAGGYSVETSEGRIEAGQVVVAVNWQRRPRVPAFTTELSPEIKQLHSSEYRNPGQLQPGGVLVVGASHSGADIAIEVVENHETWLVGPDRGQIPFRIEGRPARILIPILWFLATHVLTLRTPIGRKLAPEVRSHGGPLLRVKRSDLAAAGVHRVHAKATATRDGLPLLEDGQVLAVKNVIWCTGFDRDFSFVRLPVIGQDGWPVQDREVVPSAPGLYFAGLAFQYGFTSMLVGGAGSDGARVARRIVAHAQGRPQPREEAVNSTSQGVGSAIDR